MRIAITGANGFIGQSAGSILCCGGKRSVAITAQGARNALCRRGLQAI